MLETKELQTDITRKTLRVEHKSQPEKQDDMVDILYAQRNIDRQIWQERKEIAEAIKLMIEQQAADSKVKKTWQQIVYYHEDIFKIDSFKILRREEWKRALKKLQTAAPTTGTQSVLMALTQNYLQKAKSPQHVKFAPGLEERKEPSVSNAGSKSPPRRRGTLTSSMKSSSSVMAPPADSDTTPVSPVIDAPVDEEELDADSNTPSKPKMMSLESIKKKALALALTKVTSLASIATGQSLPGSQGGTNTSNRSRRVSQFSGSQVPQGPFHEITPLLRDGWKVGPFVVRSEKALQQYDGYRETKLVG